MMKHFYLSLRLIILTTLILAGTISTMGQDVTVDGVKYYVFIHGYGNAAIADSATVALDNDKNLSGIINIPSSVTYKYQWTEKNNNGEYITYTRYLPATVTGIENGYWWNGTPHGAFSNCTKITQVNIPNTVTSIGNLAFCGCTGLTSVTIPNSVIIIGDDAFFECTSLSSVTIPNSVIIIGSGAFAECTSLSSVTIPSSVTTIGSSAFGGCSGLTCVTIPNSVSSIGVGAFACCSGLTSVVIPNSVTSIDNEVFMYCSGLTSVKIPNSVTFIAGDAFWGCDGLTRVDITDLEAWCKITFDGLNPLEYAHHLFLNGQELKNLIVPNSITSIGDFAFAGCSGLISATIPNSVTSIGYQAFIRCSDLTSVNIGNLVTTIEYATFYDCGSLSNLTIGESVSAINYSAFYLCWQLNDITCLAKTPPAAEVTGEYPHSDPSFCNYNATLRVPIGSVEAYKTTEPWSRFSNIVGLEEEMPPGDVDGDGKVNIDDVTSLINCLLTGNVSGSGADVDGDGRVSIDDVTALINYLLSGNW